MNYSLTCLYYIRISYLQREHPHPIPASPSMSPDMVGISNESFKAQDTSRYKISKRSGHPFVSYKYHIASNFSELPPPPSPIPPKRADPVMSFTYLGIVLILSATFHPDLSALSVF